MQRVLRFCGLIVLFLALLVSPPPLRAQEGGTLPDAVPAYVPFSGVKSVVAGSLHTCALTLAGAVFCWGNDDDGQLGNGADVGNKHVPVPVLGLGSDVTQITAGYYHTCALKTNGAVLCWGRDEHGQVGNGPGITDVVAPVAVTGLGSGVLALAAGEAHSCAINAAGGVLCWGYDFDGQIGNGPVIGDQQTPVAVSGLDSNIKAIAAGAGHTCAINVLGGLLCWGLDTDGQVGDGADASDKEAPVPVNNMGVGVASVDAGGFHTCALMESGAVRCWGQDASGQIGDTEVVVGDKLTPVTVAGLGSGMKAVSAGREHTCALTVAGGALCWGYDAYGQVGNDPGTVNVYDPARVAGMDVGIASIDAGGFHTCAVTMASDVLCWGYDTLGQVGDGSMQDLKLEPVHVVIPRTCFAVSFVHTGSGSNPVASAAQSPGCPLGHYTAGATLFLQATPGANQRVQSWSAPVSGQPGAMVAALTVPAADTTVTVAYAACHVLTRSHSGSGSDPLASPDRSPGCAAGRYAAGELIVLNAVPAASQRVKAWAGATTTPAVGSQVNSLTMPGAAKAISVAYEACFALNVAVVGGGQIAQVEPAASQGCLVASSFAAGESVTLSAAPAPGFAFAGWSGGVTSSANPLQVTVAGPTSITATFSPAGLYLPLIRK